MKEFLVSILLSFSTILGIHSVPKDSNAWKTENSWSSKENLWSFRSSSDVLANNCVDGYSIVFPQVVHGIHKVWVNGKLILKTGDDTFQKTSSFYSRATLDCDYISPNSKITWEVTTYSKYFARFDEFPKIEQSSVKYYFFDVILNIASAACLIILAVFSLFVFYRRVEDKFVISLFVGSISFSIYALLTTANVFNLHIDMFFAHKVADVFVWIGSLCYIYFFKKYNYLGKIEFYSFVGSFVLGESLIIFGSNPDIVQLGTTVPIPFAFIGLCSFLIHSVVEGYRNGFTKNILLGIISISIFVLAGMNDLFHITGIINSFMIMPLGSVAGVFFLAAAVNQNIEKTYHERDGLLQNLEIKVKEKTQHLETAMSALKSTQAELIQSAKLASLGTVSAGIAHEINNSINYISGAIVPLEKKVYALIPETADRRMIEKLFAAIKEGTVLTVDIIKSLRNFTGLNHADFKQVHISESILSIQTILKSKLRGISFDVNIADDCLVNGNLVGLNQVFMNLISNSLDALDKKEKSVTIIGYKDRESIVVKIKDNGKGIPEDIKKHIFDPFFTTKDVGKGTGLGLHIVTKEIEKHGGKISVESLVGIGSEFVITLPSANISMKEAV